MRLVLTESTLLCVVGGVFGALLAMIALSLGGFAIGAEGATIAFRPTLGLGGLGNHFVGVCWQLELNHIIYQWRLEKEAYSSGPFWVR